MIEAFDQGILDRPATRPTHASILGIAGTIAVHAGIVAFAAFVGVGAAQRVMQQATRVTELVNVDLTPVAPPPSAEPKEQESVRSIAPTKERVREAPPPEAARAGEVLTSSDEVVDFGDAFVSGAGTSYAGGVTERGGTAGDAVRDERARAVGTVGGTGLHGNGDQSRAPRLAGSGVWDCPFPEEADDAGIDRAIVALRVEVSAGGDVTGARTLRDPGDGFGREARRCALSKRWAPGLDRAGNPIDAVAMVNVTFER